MNDGTLVLAELQAIEQLEQLRPEWSDLAERCPEATIFQLPEWQIPWWKHLGGGDLRCITLRQDGRLVGFAPFFVYGHPWEPRTLALLAAGVSDYQTLLLEPQIAQDGAEMVLRHLAATEPAWSSCTIEEIPPGSSLRALRVPRGLVAERADGSVCPVLELPDSSEQLLRRLSSHFRRKLRMGQHRLDRGGGGAYVTASTDNVLLLVDVLFRLHEQRWKSRNEEGALTDPRLRGFHESVATGMLGAGKLCLRALRVEEKYTAVFYGFAHQGRIYSYLTGIDPAARYYSPGTNLLHRVIDEAIAQHVVEFDMLRGEESYKYLWGARPCRNERLVLYRDRVVSPGPSVQSAGEREV